MNFVSFNGEFIPADQPFLTADNRGFRYGDGIFETMKVINGAIVLDRYHLERLFYSLNALQFPLRDNFAPTPIRKEIAALCEMNKCTALARVRLSVFRGKGNLYDRQQEMGYVIEASPLEPISNKLNAKGLVIDIFDAVSKNCDMLSNLKSANCLPYVMAAMYAQEEKIDDCLLLNVKGNLAESTIGNIFLVKGKLVITPALSEGCVAGVLRRYLLEKLRQASNLEVREGVVTKNDLESFDEVFVTNAIRGVRWVNRFRDNTYTNTQTRQIYDEYIAPLFA